ncbi:hypothetical protein [Streptomyces sp. NPDC001759]
MGVDDRRPAAGAVTSVPNVTGRRLPRPLTLVPTPSSCPTTNCSTSPLGGHIAQEIALRRPWQARRAILAGTGLQGGVGQRASDPKVLASALKDNPGPADYLFLFFKNTATSQVAGTELLQHLDQHTTDHDAPANLASRDTQLTAMSE